MRRPDCKSGGLDGWRTHEAKMLPVEIVDMFASILNMIEAGAKWPKAITTASRPFLAKGKGGDRLKALKQRGLTMMSVWYAGWGSVRYNQPEMMQWRESWLEPCMRGARKHATTQDLTYQFASTLELYDALKKQFGSVFLDKLKLVDQGISLHYKHHTSRVIKSVLYAFLGWTIGLAELYVTLYFFGYKPNLIDLWVIEALAQLVRAGSFFIPLGIGTQEGGLLLIFTALGMPGDMGITVSFVRRIKELLWVGIGLTIGWSLSCHPAQSRSKEN